MSDSDPYNVPGLVRGLAVLRSFTPQRSEQSLADIARSLGVTRSAAFRTVHTLVSEGYLLEVSGKSRYCLGPQVLRLNYGLLASRELLEVAQKPLEALRDDLDWSTHLAVLDGRHVLYLLRYPATDGLSSLVHVGSSCKHPRLQWVACCFRIRRNEKYGGSWKGDRMPKLPPFLKIENVTVNLKPSYMRASLRAAFAALLPQSVTCPAPSSLPSA